MSLGEFVILAFWFSLGLGALILGCKGFISTGLPVTGKRRITGMPARIIGVLCILFGLGAWGMGLAFSLFFLSRGT
jgi:hypothetical protein